MTIKEVLVADKRKVGVRRIMVTVVPDQGVKRRPVRFRELNIKSRKHGSHVHEIPVMEVMVAVPASPKIRKLIR